MDVKNIFFKTSLKMIYSNFSILNFKNNFKTISFSKNIILLFKDYAKSRQTATARSPTNCPCPVQIHCDELKLVS